MQANEQNLAQKKNRCINDISTLTLNVSLLKNLNKSIKCVMFKLLESYKLLVFNNRLSKSKYIFKQLIQWSITYIFYSQLDSNRFEICQERFLLGSALSHIYYVKPKQQMPFSTNEIGLFQQKKTKGIFEILEGIMKKLFILTQSNRLSNNLINQLAQIQSILQLIIKIAPQSIDFFLKESTLQTLSIFGSLSISSKWALFHQSQTFFVRYLYKQKKKPNRILNQNLQFLRAQNPQFQKKQNIIIMQQELNLRCDGYNIQFISQDNEKLVCYKAKLSNEYLANDKQMEGKYFRKVHKQIDDQTFLVKHPKGQTLEQFIQMNDTIPEKIIETILIQILEGLATLYKSRIPGRCFSIGNIIWDGSNITMMSFGLYPEISETLINYNHKLDTLLLGQIAYCLITCTSKVETNYLEALISPPISQTLKELTNRMLSPEDERIQLWEVVEDLKKNMSEDAYKFYINKYQNCCQILDQIIEERESQVCSTIDISEQQLKSEVLNNQEDMSYLLYYNKKIDKDEIIWEELHDELYKIYILTNLKSIIEEKYQDQENSIYMDQLKFIVDKTTLIVMCKFERYLATQFSRESFDKLRKILKDKVNFEKQFFNANDIEAIKSSAKVKKDTGKHFQMDIFEDDFNDIKVAFRSYVLVVYRYYQKNAQNCQDPQEKWELSKIQLQVLMAIVLNQVIKNKEMNFKTVKKVVGTDKIRLNDIEIRFFEQANVEDIQEQISEINKIYFSK